MPNDISNEIVISSKNADEALKSVETLVETEHDSFIRHFDFNKLIPMPEDLTIESSTRADAALLYYLRQNMLPQLPVYEIGPFTDSFLEREYKNGTIDEEFIELGKKAYMNVKKYGHKNWYDWSYANWNTKWNSYANWNTKWNSYASKRFNKTIYFETAWNSPVKLVEMFIKQHKLTCTYRSICEGGIFWFIKKYQDGELILDRVKLDEDYKKLRAKLNRTRRMKVEE